MFYYARSDTHFLLYIYDNLRNELIERSKNDKPEENRLETVINKSKETSLLRYERQIYEVESGKGPGGWYQMLVKTPALFTNEQFAVFKAVHGWRDRIARMDDDSTNFVMPNHVIFTLAKLMPVDMVSLLGAAHPISHAVKSRSGELLDVIKKAKIAGQNGPSMMDVLRPKTTGAAAGASLPGNDSDASKPPAVAASLDPESDAEVRSTKSRFWGSAFGSSIWDATSQSISQSTMRLAIPLPPLSSSVFALAKVSAMDSARVDTAEREREAQHQAMREQEEQAQRENEAFSLKSGKKRKASPEAPSGDYDISLDPEAEAASAAKATRKAQRKAEKKAEKAARRQAQGQEGGMVGLDTNREEAEEAFDYSKAEPVLHGKREGKQGGGTARKQKPFDPYAKSTDTSQGMRRVQTERPGKSLTFRS